MATPDKGNPVYTVELSRSDKPFVDPSTYPPVHRKGRRDTHWDLPVPSTTSERRADWSLPVQ
jgi:hypothetical protein